MRLCRRRRLPALDHFINRHAESRELGPVAVVGWPAGVLIRDSLREEVRSPLEGFYCVLASNGLSSSLWLEASSNCSAR